MVEVEWGNLKASELRALSDKNAIVLVPVASIEQHGPHLPVQVDTLLAGEVCCRAAKRIAETEPIVVTPVMWMGLAEHHMSFGGTLTADLDTFRAVLRCICRSIIRHGFRRILVVNGHGGNIAALNVIVGELSCEFETAIGFASYWQVAADQFATILEQQTTVRHACEAETSMMLALRPDLVDVEKMSTLKPPMQGAGLRGGVYFWQPMAKVSEIGVVGAPAAATAEKGQHLLDAAAEALCNRLLAGDLW